MFNSISIKAPISDVAELDRLCKLVDLSRSEYIRPALENYDKNPQAPLFTKVNDLARGENTRPVTLMLTEEQAAIIVKYQDLFYATKVQIIRQALIQEAPRHGQTYNTYAPLPIDPKWEGVWVKATDIYGELGMHRNVLYRAIKNAGIETHTGLKTGQHPEKWYRLTDIIKYYRLDETQSKNLAKLAKFKCRDWKELARYWEIDTSKYSDQELAEQIMLYAESDDDLDIANDIKDFVSFITHGPREQKPSETEEEKKLRELEGLALWRLINLKDSQEVKRQFKEILPCLMAFSNN